MRLKVPMTGTVLEYDPVAAQIDGLGVAGDNNDPVKLIDINLGNVSWRLMSLDLENDLAGIEITPSEIICIPTGVFRMVDTFDENENPISLEREIHETRLATAQEKHDSLVYAKNAIESHTVDELYTMTNSARLVKPVGTVQLYKDKPPNKSARERMIVW